MRLNLGRQNFFLRVAATLVLYELLTFRLGYDLRLNWVKRDVWFRFRSSHDAVDQEAKRE